MSFSTPSYAGLFGSKPIVKDFYSNCEMSLLGYFKDNLSVEGLEDNALAAAKFVDLELALARIQQENGSSKRVARVNAALRFERFSFSPCKGTNSRGRLNI